MEELQDDKLEEIVPENSAKIKHYIIEITNRVLTWKVLKPILCGQGLSLLICGTAISSEYLQNLNVSVPLTQSLINYVLLSIVYTTTLVLKKNDDGQRRMFAVLKQHWWKYVLLAAVDVEANYLVVKAYEYTSLTSVQLLDCFILPVVMILSYFALKIRYISVHYIGVVVALAGVGCMVGADVLVGRNDGGQSASNPALGDVLVLGSAVLYGISNVSMEYITKKHKYGNVEILGMFGLFCPLINGVQVVILEREILSRVKWNIEIVGFLALFGLCMFLLYSLLPIVMKLSSATTVNISLLTADLYALFAGLFLFNQQMSALYVVSFVTIVVALVIYNSRQPLSRLQPATETATSELESSTSEDNNHNLLDSQSGTWFSAAYNATT